MVGAHWVTQGIWGKGPWYEFVIGSAVRLLGHSAGSDIWHAILSLQVSNSFSTSIQYFWEGSRTWVEEVNAAPYRGSREC